MLLHDFFDIKKPKVKEDSWHGGGNEPKDAWHSEAGVVEGRVASPVSRAITHRILDQRQDLLKFGPQAVMDAVEQVAEWVGEVEEIGNSDISAWVAQVARHLQTQDEQGVAEGLSEPTRKVFFKVIKTQGTGMPSGYRRVKTMRPLEDGGFYIELSTPGYGMDYTRHNYKNFSLKDDQGKPITGQEANNIINGKQGVAEGLPGEFIGGTAGGVGGAVVGAAVGGPIGAVVGGAAGGTAGQIAGRELTDEQKLNEFGPLLLAGARLFMAAAPKIAQVFGKVGQAGARGVGQAAKAGAGIAAKNAGQIGIGAGAYEIGSSVADIVKDITAKVGAAVDEKTIFDLATLAFKYAIPAGIVLAILYGGKKAIDSLFADPKTPQGVAEARIETIHGSAYTIDPNKYYVWAWDNAVVLYGEYTDENDAELNLSKIERRATKRLGPAVKYRFEVASGKMLLRQYGEEQGVAEEGVNDPHIIENAGIDFDMQFDDDTGSFAELTARAQGRTLGSVKFFVDGDTLIADQLEVDERYRGQGIAAAMYNYAKSQGYTVEKSDDLTPDGEHFWNKNRGEQAVWEGVAEGLAEDNLNELDKSTLGSYVKKAAADVNIKSRDAQHHKDMWAGDYPVRGAKKQARQNQANIDKRVVGISRAVDRLAAEGVAEGFPHDVDHMPGKTIKHQDTNCTTCHGRKSMYKLGNKLSADNKQGAEKVKCPTCKGTGDKPGVAEAKAPSVIQTIRDNISVDEISKDREGNLIFRRGFFYTNNGSAEQFAARIDNELTNLNIPHTIVDKGQVWRPFKGGATTKSQSHWWVKVKISQPGVAEADKKRNPTRDFLRKHPVPDSEMVKPVKKQGNQDAKTSLSHMMGGSSNELMKNLKIKEQGVSESINYWNKLQDTRNKKINSLVDELEKSIK